MSDYCYFEITFRKEDAQELSKIFGYGGSEFWDDVVEEEEKYMRVCVTQANYGYYEQCGQAASKGLVFFGYHDSGGDYESQLFVGFGGKYINVPQINRWPAARLDDSGNVMEEDVKEAKEYILYHQLAVKYLEGTLNAQKDSGSQPQAGSV